MVQPHQIHTALDDFERDAKVVGGVAHRGEGVVRNDAFGEFPKHAEGDLAIRQFGELGDFRRGEAWVVLGQI